jgi:hypothetical protein
MLMISAISALWLALRADTAVAQEKSFKEKLIGTWTLVQCEVIASDGKKAPLVLGKNPAGQYIFTADGHFSFQATAVIPNFASNDRMTATPEESKAAVQASIAYYGLYTVNDGARIIDLHIERSSFPNLNGTDGRRIVTALSVDEMKYINPGRMAGGSINCAYKRAQ